MRVLDRGYAHVRVLVDGAGRDVVAAEELRHLLALALGPADLGVRREVGDRSLDERFGAAAVDLGRLAALVFPLRDEQGRKPHGVVAVRMGDEHAADLAEVVARLDEPPRHAIAGVDEIERLVDHEQVRRLRAAARGKRAAARAERDDHRGVRRRLRL